VRARYGISPRVGLTVNVNVEDTQDAALLDEQRTLVTTMAHVDELTIGTGLTKPAQASVSLATGLQVYTILTGLVDFAAERVRLEKSAAKLEKECSRLDKKLSNPGYLAKAAKEIIDKDRAKRADAADKLDRVKEQIEEIGA
jgi:valyl-tRNA synthetase